MFRSRLVRRAPLLLPALALPALLLPLLSRGDGPPRGDKYALLIGVRRYDPNELRELPYAEADMTALADVLKKAGYTRVVLLTQTNGVEQGNRFLPMAANIRTSLKGVLADLSPDDTVLVAFAGHGVQYSGEEDNYFCPMDAKLAHKTTLISLNEVYKELEQSAAGTRLLLADCCRNDPRSEEARAANREKLESVARPQTALPPGGVAAFFSCSAGEKAFEPVALGHGVFFHFVIKGLQGDADLDRDGQVDLEELVQYTKKNVRNFVKDAYGDDVRQMPELIGKTHGTVALVKLDDGGRPDAATNGSRTTLAGERPAPLDCTGEKGVSAAEVKKAQEAWAKYLGRKVEEEDEIAPGMKMKFALVPPGKFLMGSPKDEKERSADEGPQHAVEITRPFYLGVCPVTKGQFAAFIKDDGYQTQNEKAKLGPPFGPWQHPFADYDPTADDPVVCVSWEEAVKFCEWLSKKEKKTYQLPTEAQWEYACRAGTTTAYSFGDDPKDLGAYAWYFDNAGGHTRPVGGKKPNPWGLYDMHGDVFQWCADYYDRDYYRRSPAKDPQNLDKGDFRVIRGGCWHAVAKLCRSADRNWNKPDLSTYDYGFRVVLRPD